MILLLDAPPVICVRSIEVSEHLGAQIETLRSSDGTCRDKHGEGNPEDKVVIAG